MAKQTLLVLIDDDTDDQEIFKMAVDDLGKPINCLFFADCESAIAHFSQQTAGPPSCVFIDMKLSRQDADQCLQQLQQLRQFDNPFLVVYSSSIPANLQERFERFGVDKVIQKTDSISELTTHIEEAISAS